MQNIKRANNKGKIQWNTTIFMIIFHVGTLCALYFFSWKWLAVSILLNWIGGSLGIGIGFHRLMTHRGFQTPKIVEYFLAVCGTFALQGGPINWVVTHRIHHAFTEGPNDPHSPRDGRWWAHMGWILRGTAQQHSEKVMRRYAPDLMKDPVHVWINRLYFVPLSISGIVLFLIGGFPAVLWGVFLRVTLGLHATWLVNSATHLWGKRRFETSDDSTNNWWVALLTFGEGWHNNHHAYPTAARHGLRWYEIDINWWGITALKVMGLAKSIKLVSKDQIEASEEYGALRKVA
jgi:fatty-acid desaturase